MSSGIIKATQKLWHNLIILAENDTRASAPTSTIREIHFMYGKSRESPVCVCVCVCVSHSVMSNCLQPHELDKSEPARLLYPWDSPDKNRGAGCHSLLQRIFLTQGLNLGLLHCRQIP